MAWFFAFLGLVGAIQGLAWAGAESPRRRVGALLAPIGLLLFALGVTAGLVPDFFSDRAGFDGR